MSRRLAGCMLVGLLASPLLVSPVLAGCGSDPKPEPQVATSEAPEKAVKTVSDADGGEPPASATDKDQISSVGIDERILKMCDLPMARFDFDSASMSSDARSVLDKIAQCFIGGAARKHNMRIVGHTDERGETEYNFALGQRRAGAVAGYMLQVGLAVERVASSSRGELEATGTDAAGWAQDRRVEILLAD